ncbi:MAG: hypothetical protein AAGK14_05000 [Verrucomicrobiota bacterium]
MARRASSRPKWGLIALVVVLIAGGGVGTYYLSGTVNDPYRTLQPLDLGAYYENANSLRSNQYKVDGTVLNQLKWHTTQGRLFSFDVDSTRDSRPVGILIPPEFASVNVQKGQQFIIKVEVVDDGILLARDIRKQ